MRAKIALAGLSLLAMSACELSPCTFYDGYSPPSATAVLINARSGKRVCDASAGIAYEGVDAGSATQELYPLQSECGYQFPGWERTLGAPLVTLEVEGFLPLEIVIERPAADQCDQLIPPELEFELVEEP